MLHCDLKKAQPDCLTCLLSLPATLGMQKRYWHLLCVDASGTDLVRNVGDKHGH